MIELFGNLCEHLGMPVIASSHGLMLDQMSGWVHWLMIILFVGWGIFFIVTLFKFGIISNGKVDRDGVQSHASTYGEYAVILVEAFILVSFAIPLWSLTKTDIPDVTEDTVEIRVVAQQFAWNIHYPGVDGKFGRTYATLVDEEINPIGLDRSSPHGADDIVTLNQMHLPVDKQTIIYLSSKDVIHSFFLPEMRVKQDAVPGMSTPIFFTPTMTSDEFMVEIKGSAREGKGFEIACAQLCGNSHYRMRGFLTIDTEDEYNAWLDEEAELLEEEGDDDDW
jgi:cytochrome c oxidase subunit 2